MAPPSRRPTQFFSFFLLLLAGHLSAGGDPIPRALSLFSAEELATMPRVVLATVKPERTTTGTEGYAVPGYPVVYIAAWSDTYKAAEVGDRNAIIKLAGIIAHERAHVDRGSAEGPAYDAEILMLRRCGAPAAMIDGVRQARNDAERRHHEAARETKVTNALRAVSSSRLAREPLCIESGAAIVGRCSKERV